MEYIMNYVSYEEASEIVEKVKNGETKKIIVFMLGKPDCPACNLFGSDVFPQIKKEVGEDMEIYGIRLGVDYDTLFAPLRSPMFYFFVPNSEVFPIIRENLPPPEMFINEIKVQKRIVEGESYYEVYAQKIAQNQKSPFPN